ncbi:hypothetical protein [Mycobacterium sp.]|uniref:Rv0361 family membrane protein n=1 Tax=Mycobacterium sp. TaxID=1785 RepID=UPI003C70C8B4
MAGPYPQYSDPQLSQPPIAAASVYPGMLPPPVPYPSGRRWRLLAVILLVVAIVGGATTAVVYALTADSHAPGSGQLTEAAAKAAIQDYLDAMEEGDTETVARNTQCGYYDEIKDKRSHQALARLTSETFRKQFSRAEVTSIDKMVFMSTNQAQVLFSMQVAPVSRGSKKQEEQAIAQVLSTDDSVLVCQYLLLSAGQY